LPTGRDGWPLLLRRPQGLLQLRGWRLQVGLRLRLRVGLCLLLVLCVLLRLHTGESLLRSMLRGVRSSLALHRLTRLLLPLKGLGGLQVLIIEHNTLAARAVGVVL